VVENLKELLMSESVHAIEIRDLHKTYTSKANGNPKVAVDGVNLTVPRGSFFGLLGPNGAGKSTIINIMAGLVIKSAGTVRIAGYDIDTDERQAKQAIGVVPQELVLDTFFTVRQALDIHAGYYGVPKAKRRTQEIIDAMGLSDKADSKPRALSGGMRRRLLIGKALVHTPSVLILDEPTAGVDIELRQQLWAYVRELNARGTTILLTTHYLEEAEELCDQIAIINHGKVVACDTKQRLMAGFENKRLVIRVQDSPEILPAALLAEGWERMNDGQLMIRYKPEESNLEVMLSHLREQGLVMCDLTTKDTDLEDIFRHLTRSEI
jgi:ABC-2 type transport system ATP-binding protein